MEGYMTIKRAAAEWGVIPRRVRVLCVEGRIEGAMKFGRDCSILLSANKPLDKRITSGKYKNWRK